MKQLRSPSPQKPPVSDKKSACGCKQECCEPRNPARVLQEMAHEPQSTDVLGSYTGTPADGGMPQQDADDL